MQRKTNTKWQDKVILSIPLSKYCLAQSVVSSGVYGHWSPVVRDCLQIGTLLLLPKEYRNSIIFLLSLSFTNIKLLLLSTSAHCHLKWYQFTAGTQSVVLFYSKFQSFFDNFVLQCQAPKERRGVKNVIKIVDIVQKTRELLEGQFRKDLYSPNKQWLKEKKKIIIKKMVLSELSLQHH